MTYFKVEQTHAECDNHLEYSEFWGGKYKCPVCNVIVPLDEEPIFKGVKSMYSSKAQRIRTMLSRGLSVAEVSRRLGLKYQTVMNYKPDYSRKKKLYMREFRKRGYIKERHPFVKSLADAALFAPDKLFFDKQLSIQPNFTNGIKQIEIK